METSTPNGPANAVSQLSQNLSQAAESQRSLMNEMALFAKDESLRFTTLRLERNGQALEKLSTCIGLPGLIGLQQEWMRDLIADYAGQNMRLAGAWRGVAQAAVHQAGDAADQTMDRAQAAATDMAQQTGEAMDAATDAGQQVLHDATEQAGNFSQDLNNNYVQH